MVHFSRCIYFCSFILCVVLEIGIIVGNGRDTFFWFDRWFGDVLYCVYYFTLIPLKLLLINNF